ncbi:MAG: hypothetical protein AAF944_28335 [Bacteroidota bacterium]
MKTLLTLLLLTFTLFASIVNGQSVDDDEKKLENPVALHTRLVVGSPHYTYNHLETISYDYSDLKALNVGGSLKLQAFNFLYGEYALLTNLYRQLSSHFFVGLETPSKGIRFGVRYQFANDQLMPFVSGETRRDLQVYLNLGGPRGGIEVAIGNLNEFFGQDQVADAINITDVQVRWNIALWSTKK